MTEPSAITLKLEWECDDDPLDEGEVCESWRAFPEWWRTFVVMQFDTGWKYNWIDHDAGVDEQGKLYSAYNDWSDETFLTWQEAAAAAEGNYGVENTN